MSLLSLFDEGGGIMVEAEVDSSARSEAEVDASARSEAEVDASARSEAEVDAHADSKMCVVASDAGGGAMAEAE